MGSLVSVGVDGCVAFQLRVGEGEQAEGRCGVWERAAVGERVEVEMSCEEDG